ncbi:MAG: GntR family transcriptional regulator [Candidatus Cloacimonetes bacterium]|nr:GntR family transcriptional regulator [Candidatus Cloacimonadota bacterium]
MKFDDSIPIYLQIKEEIENAIITNSIREEEAIPSIRVLAQQYRLNPQTVSNAVSELLSEGLLFKKRGIGMFVQKGARQMLRTKKIEDYLDTEIRKIFLKGKQLGISKEDLIGIMNKVYQEKGE